MRYYAILKANRSFYFTPVEIEPITTNPLKFKIKQRFGDQLPGWTKAARSLLDIITLMMIGSENITIITQLIHEEDIA